MDNATAKNIIRRLRREASIEQRYAQEFQDKLSKEKAYGTSIAFRQAARWIEEKLKEAE